MVVTRSGASSPVGESAGGDNCTARMGEFEENCTLVQEFRAKIDNN